jgi:hypothetical protein
MAMSKDQKLSLEDEALRKGRESALRALKLADSVSDFISLCAPENEIYKGVLMCRLEVQYALAVLQISRHMELHPKKARSQGNIMQSFVKLSSNLSKSLTHLHASEVQEAVEALLDADTTLGRVIGAMRRGRGITKGNAPEIGKTETMSDGVNGQGFEKMRKRKAGTGSVNQG